MSATGLDVFDKTLQTTHIWLDELMVEIGSDRQAAWHVLGTVLRAVRDRIPLELAVHLGSQLLVRGLYYDQWHAAGRMDEKPHTLDAFLEPIGEQLAQTRPINTHNATHAVFRILSRHVSPGQIERSSTRSQAKCRPSGLRSRPTNKLKWSGPTHEGRCRDGQWTALRRVRCPWCET